MSEHELLDLSEFPLTNDQFGDLEHLNHKGAKVFSQWFDQMLKKDLLLKKNKQEWIDDNFDRENYFNL